MEAIAQKMEKGMAECIGCLQRVCLFVLPMQAAGCECVCVCVCVYVCV